MAYTFEFETKSDLIPFLKQAKESTAELVSKTDAVNQSLRKQAQEGVEGEKKLAAAVAAVGTAMGKINQETGKADTSAFAKGIGQAVVKADEFGAAMNTAGSEAKSNFSELIDKSKQLATQQGIVVGQIDEQTDSMVESLVAAKALTAEEGKMAKEALTVLKAFDEQAKASGNGAMGIKNTANEAKSLRSQLREAKEELAKLEEASDGKITPEFIAAAKRAGELQDRISDTNATIQAFNPDAKFQAFGQVIQAGAGGLTAFQGALGLVGGETDAVAQSLLKVQSALAVTQGLQAFFGGFRDGVRNINAIITSLTVAQTASTAAGTADIPVKAGQAAATGGLGAATTATTAATGGLTGALNTLKAAVVTNPIGAIVVGLLAAGAALVALSDNAEEGLPKVEKLLDKMRFNEEDVGRLRKVSDELNKLESDLVDAEQGDTVERRKARVIEENQRAVAKLNQDIVRSKQEQNDLLKQLAELDSDAEDYKNASEKINEELDKRVAAISDYSAQRFVEEESVGIKLRIIETNANKEAIERIKKQGEDRKRFLQQNGQELIQLQEQLTQRLINAEEAVADPRRKLELQRQSTDRELQQIERDLLRKVALLQLEEEVGVAAIEQMGKARLNARLDALIQERNLELGADQQDELNSLRLFKEQAFANELRNLMVDEANARISIIENASERERAEFEAGLQARIDVLRKANVDEDAIITFGDRQREQFTNARKLKVIESEEAIASAEIDARIASSGRNIELLRSLEEEKINIQVEFAQKRLAIIEAADTEESRVQAATIRKTIAELEKARNEIQAKANAQPFSLLRLLGINDEDRDEVSQALGSIVSSSQSIITQIISDQQAEVAARISATDEILDDASRRKNELERLIQEDLENQRRGLANNLDANREALEQVKAEEQKALEEKRKQQEEQRKLARQQSIVESTQQASSLLTAGARLFAEGAFKGPVGIITGIATIAAMISSFVALKAKVNAATQFKHGGALMLHGPSHEHGGLGIYNEQTGERVGEAEGSEAAIFFVNRGKAKEAMPYLNALNEGGRAALLELAEREIERMIGPMGIVLEEKPVRELVTSKTMVERSAMTHTGDTSELRRDINRLNGTVKEIKDGFDRERKKMKITPFDGGYIKESNGVIEIVRRNKNG